VPRPGPGREQTLLRGRSPHPVQLSSQRSFLYPMILGRCSISSPRKSVSTARPSEVSFPTRQANHDISSHTQDRYPGTTCPSCQSRVRRVSQRRREREKRKTREGISRFSSLRSLSRREIGMSKGGGCPEFRRYRQKANAMPAATPTAVAAAINQWAALPLPVGRGGADGEVWSPRMSGVSGFGARGPRLTPDSGVVPLGRLAAARFSSQRNSPQLAGRLPG
jgi:hypothetical protein